MNFVLCWEHFIFWFNSNLSNCIHSLSLIFNLLIILLYVFLEYPVVDEEMLKWDLDKFLVPKEKKMPSKQKNDWDYDIDTIKEHVNLTKKISAENELINGSTMPEYKPFFYETNRQRIKRNKMIRDKSAGKNWFNMEAPEITQEIKNDLQILKMRSAIDSKHFYKRNDQKGLLKFFQVSHLFI